MSLESEVELIRERATSSAAREIPLAALTNVVGNLPDRDALHGFGRLWRKVHAIGFGSVDVSPVEVIRVWRENFGALWPEGNRFWSPAGALQSGEVAVLNLEMPGATRLATGVLVLYADDEAFTLMTPHGHMFAGWVTFTAYRADSETVAQIEIVMRATDPAFEIGLELFGHRRENRFWEQTLRNLASHFGAESEPETRSACLDRQRQWRYARNVWHNSAVRSALHIGLAPIQRMSQRAGRGQPTSEPEVR